MKAACNERAVAAKLSRANERASTGPYYGGYTMTTEDKAEQTLEDLSAKLNEYCDANGLEHLSADELLCEQYSIEPRNDKHIEFLKAFIEEWDAAVR